VEARVTFAGTLERRADTARGSRSVVPRTELVVVTSRWPGFVVLALLVGAIAPAGCMPETVRPYWTAAWCAFGAVFALAVACRRVQPCIAPGVVPVALLAVVAFAQAVLPTLPTEAAQALVGDVLASGASVAPSVSIQRGCELLALLVVAVATATFVGRRSGAVGAARSDSVLCHVLLASAVLASLYGVLAFVGVVPRLGADQPSDAVNATYYNRNHFAYLLEFAILGGVGATFAAHASGRVRLAIATALGSTMCVAALVLTGSRGGLCGLLVGGAVTAVVVVSSQALVSRVAGVGSELATAGMRPDIWRGALALVAAFPFGSGLGTYGLLSPLTQHPAVPGRVEHAHSDPLELLVEAGPIGVALVGLAGVALVRAVLRGIGAVDGARAWFVIGTAGALAAAAMHAFVDFNLHVPANAAWTVALAAWLGATVTRRRLATSRSVRIGAGTAAVVLALAAAHTLRTAPDVTAFDARALRAEGLALLRVDPVAAERTLHAALANVNPFDRADRQRDIGVACIVEGHPDVGARLLRKLLRRQPSRTREILAAVHDRLPVAEVLLACLPGESIDGAVVLARLLAERGDLHGREVVLAARRGTTLPDGQVTLSTDVVLTERHVASRSADTGVEVDVRLRCASLGAIADGAWPVLTLRWSGPRDAVVRTFRAAPLAFEGTLRLDESTPPGRYTLALTFDDGAARLPLLTVDLAHAPVTVMPGTPVAASRMHRIHAATTRLQREVVVPSTATEVAVVTNGVADVVVQVDGRELRRLDAGGLATARFAWPSSSTPVTVVVTPTRPELVVDRLLWIERRSR
jgi:hypothetical protein